MESFFIAQITMFCGTFAPQSTAFCHGQLLSINDYNALFALLGTTFGGNGQTTFALPDLRGRMAIGQGNAPGLGNFTLGESSGTNGITLTQAQMPNHTHTASGVRIPVSTNAPNSNSPNGNFYAPSNSSIYASTQSGPQALGGVSMNVGANGGSQPFSNNMPYLGINFVIALEGIFPSRN